MNGFLAANSISVKLTRLNLLVTGTALLFAFVSFLAYDFFSYRENLVQNLFAEAQIVGANSVTALLFDDPQSAQTTLAALRSSPDVISAALIDEDGSVFAEYRAPGTNGPPELRPIPKDSNRVQWSHGSRLVVGYRVFFSGRAVGAVYIQAHLAEPGSRIRQYGLTAALILLFCMAAALLVTATFRRLVTEPITSLATTARNISREKDFSVRAAANLHHDEIAVLVEAFNEMLQEIQKRDRALLEAREDLERRVQERTAELRAANRELEAFSYSVAHDLRGPLDVIVGLGYILQTSFQDRFDREGLKMLEAIQRSSKNMAGMIDDLLNLSRAATVGLDRRQIDLTAMAQSIAEDLLAAEPGRNVRFTIAEGATVHADEGLMRVVMENLIRNAWKYTSRHSQASIEFAWTVREGRLIFFVRDDGAGFDPERAGKLFLPFQRLHGLNEFPGTGIGLATVQRVIARHGGKVWAEGRVEQGATFYFSL